jgi:membrane-associated phospholipid phosphatase
VALRLGGTLSYPSGHVTTATAMFAVLVLAAPAGWRWLVGVLAGCATVLVVVAVVATREHYLTDAVGAVILVIGTVLLVDGVTCCVRLPPSWGRASRPGADP